MGWARRTPAGAAYGDLIAGFARRQGPKDADRDDIVQEVLMSLVKTLPGFRYDPDKGRFRGYLKTMCSNAIQRRLRTPSAGAGIVETPSHVQDERSEAAAEAAWEGEWRQYHLRRAMRCIDTEFNTSDRSAFQLYAIEGRAVAAVSAALQMRADQVYQAKSRILRCLTALVAGQVAEEGSAPWQPRAAGSPTRFGFSTSCAIPTLLPPYQASPVSWIWSKSAAVAKASSLPQRRLRLGGASRSRCSRAGRLPAVSGACAFEREVRLAATLAHEGIVRVHDSGVTPEGCLYLVMELVEGQRLEAWWDGLVAAPQRRQRTVVGTPMRVDSA